MAVMIPACIGADMYLGSKFKCLMDEGFIPFVKGPTMASIASEGSLSWASARPALSSLQVLAIVDSYQKKVEILVGLSPSLSLCV